MLSGAPSARSKRSTRFRMARSSPHASVRNEARAAGSVIPLAAMKMSRSLMAVPSSWGSLVAPEGGDEPGTGISPVRVGRAFRDAERGCGFLERHAGEVAEFHHLRRTGLRLGELVERLVE